MIEDNILEIPYAKYAKIDSPYRSDNRVVFHFFINVIDIPKGLPTEVNPREVNTHKKVYKIIVNALTEENNSFFVNNRGLLISAKGVKVDVLNHVLKLDIGNGSSSDNSQYGVLDGGHTYNAIINNINNIPRDIEQYVHLEIMTNVRNIDELSSARNTSVQVSDKAIAELANKFGFIKEAIKNESYSDKVAYKENADEPIDAIDFVRLLFAFNISKYNSQSSKQPIQAYSGKSAVLNDYLKEYNKKNNFYRKLAVLLPKITRLYDTIEEEIPDAYHEQNPKGRVGKIKGIDPVRGSTKKSKYYDEKIGYRVSQGIIFPILSAFRALLVEDSEGNIYWEADPLKIWRNIRVKLVNNTIAMSRSLGNNPQSAGKNPLLWSQNFDAVDNAKLKVLLEKNRNY